MTVLQKSWTTQEREKWQHASDRVCSHSIQGHKQLLQGKSPLVPGSKCLARAPLSQTHTPNLAGSCLPLTKVLMLGHVTLQSAHIIILREACLCKRI
jgi:hypothetical protein